MFPFISKIVIRSICMNLEVFTVFGPYVLPRWLISQNNTSKNWYSFNWIWTYIVCPTFHLFFSMRYQPSNTEKWLKIDVRNAISKLLKISKIHYLYFFLILYIIILYIIYSNIISYISQYFEMFEIRKQCPRNDCLLRYPYISSW